MYEYPQCYDYDYYDSDDYTSIQEPEPEPKRTRKIPTPVFKTYDEEIRYGQWREHRTRLKEAGPVLDNDPVSIKPVGYTRMCNLRTEAIKYLDHTMENISILKTLSQIQRANTTNYFRNEPVIGLPSAVPRNVQRIETIERENREMGKRIMEMTSSINTGRNVEKQGKKRMLLDQPFILPKKALAKYAHMPVTIPKTNKERHQLFRPHIFFEVFQKGKLPLGPIVLELFTEAAPQVVLQLVKSCYNQEYDRFSIRRIFPGLWLDIDLPIEYNSKLHNQLEYDGKVIDHGETDYVLSFRKDYLQGFPSYLTFSLAFKPISMANGKRIGFGRLIRGAKILDSLQSFGNKFGTVTRNIKFINCGLL